MRGYRICLIRHGMTEANEKGIYIGSTDLPLSEKGANELLLKKDSMDYPYVDRVYTSPLRRCTGTADILFTNMGEKEVAYLIPVVASLRAKGVRCEIYPDPAKLKKQFEYADRKGIRYLAIVGEDEVAEGTVSIKNLSTGEQRKEDAKKISGLTW